MVYPSYQVYISNIRQTPKEDWIDDFQEFVNSEFYNSSSWFTIQEETSFGAGTYSNIDARVNYVFNPTTGQNMGDDWKILMFSDIDKQVSYGSLFLFDSNYWVTVNVENKKNLTSTCIVRRCNNTLRWLEEETGAIYSVPCVLDYNIQENRNYSSAMSAIVNPSGILQVISQLNSYSNKITPNKRFLFGNADNWIGYKVFGGGVNNFNNLETMTNSSNGILKLTLGVDFVNEETDDLVNGIADVDENVYTITIVGVTSGEISTQSQLSANVYLNGSIVARDVVWSSDDDDIVTVSATGLVTFVGLGVAQVCATLTDNSTVQTCSSVETLAIAANEYVIKITPTTNYILEDDEGTFVVNLYLDGVLQADEFVFTIVPSDVPSDNYTFTVIDGNTFKIENDEMFLTDTLDVRCVSGLNSNTFSFRLRGAW